MPEAVKDFLAGIASIFDFTDSANRDLDVVRSERDDFALLEKDGQWSTLICGRP